MYTGSTKIVFVLCTVNKLFTQLLIVKLFIVLIKKWTKMRKGKLNRELLLCQPQAKSGSPFCRSANSVFLTSSAQRSKRPASVFTCEVRTTKCRRHQLLTLAHVSIWLSIAARLPKLFGVGDSISLQYETNESLRQSFARQLRRTWSRLRILGCTQRTCTSWATSSIWAFTRPAARARITRISTCNRNEVLRLNATPIVCVSEYKYLWTLINTYLTDGDTCFASDVLERDSVLLSSPPEEHLRRIGERATDIDNLH